MADPLFVVSAPGLEIAPTPAILRLSGVLLAVLHDFCERGSLGLNRIRLYPSIQAIHVHVHVWICVSRVPAEVSPSRESSARSVHRSASVIADKGPGERDVRIRRLGRQARFTPESIR